MIQLPPACKLGDAGPIRSGSDVIRPGCEHSSPDPPRRAKEKELSQMFGIRNVVVYNHPGGGAFQSLRLGAGKINGLIQD